MKIIGSVNGAIIEWDDGALTVSPPTATEDVERLLSKPVEAWRSVEDVEQGRIDEVVVSIPPGTAEHVARSILAAPGGILIEGDEAIPSDDDAELDDEA